MREIRDSDVAAMNRWRKRRNLTPAYTWELPSYGLCIPGVAVGFLRRAEGNLAIVEALCTNPLVSAPLRHQALEQLFKELTKDPSFTYLGYSTDGGIIPRAQWHGFKVVKQTLLVKECS